jgi:hypothetical protein
LLIQEMELSGDALHKRIESTCAFEDGLSPIGGSAATSS